MTVRELVRQYQKEIQGTDLEPERAAALLTKLSALIGDCNREIRDADALYAQYLVVCLDAHKSSVRAKAVAETSPEYARRREARDVKELVLEMARALKFYLRSKSDERQLARQS